MTSPYKISERLLAVQILGSLLQQHGSLAGLLDNNTLAKVQSPALLQELCYGVCRWYPRLQFYLQKLLDKPLRSKDLDVQCLLLVALYQLLFMRTPDHATVNESVAAVETLGKSWAKALVNAVLRKAQREQADLNALAERDYSVWYAHPEWLLNQLKKDWPQDYRTLLDGNNQRAPMTLRVNARQATREQALGLLTSAGVAVKPGALSPYSLYLAQPMDAVVIPGFVEGLVSVQDEASQLVASLLPLAANLRVLDACAAPGGKPVHCWKQNRRCRCWRSTTKRGGCHASRRISNASGFMQKCVVPTSHERPLQSSATSIASCSTCRARPPG